MGAAIFILFMVVMTMLITILVFGGWLTISIIRLIANVIATVLGFDKSAPRLHDPRMPGNANGARTPPPMMPAMMPPPRTMACTNPSCRNVNPVVASFCRRCGQRLPQPQRQRVAVRRAALW